MLGNSIAESFTVLRRAVQDDPYMELSACKQCLPAWVIEFLNGERITVGPEEVIDMPEK